MIKEVEKDIKCLCYCQEATAADRLVITNTLETFREFKKICPYLSANMIGEAKRIFVIEYNTIDFLFINPEIISSEDEYIYDQTCFYYKAHRTATRYKEIEVKYKNSDFEDRTMVLKGEFALNFLHMMDHINGIKI